VYNFLLVINSNLDLILHRCWDHRHHHRQPWVQCPLVSDAIVAIAGVEIQRHIG